ncbi:MAG: response regulator, partial [Campylobacterota bacterium]
MKKILIVDQNLTLLKAIKKVLTKKIKNIETVTFQTHKEGLEYIENTQNDEIVVALINVKLPDAPVGSLVDISLQNEIPTIVFSNEVDKQITQQLAKKKIIDLIMRSGAGSFHRAITSIERVVKNYHKTVLVVDDSKTQLLYLRGILEKMKLSVITAENGKEALQILRKKESEISLVVTDYHMPVMDGIDFTLQARQEYQKDSLGIIAVSGVDNEDLATEFLKIGANDFINKPFKEVEVQTRVESNLELLDLFKKAKDLSEKDFLSGAFNRRHFFKNG